MASGSNIYELRSWMYAHKDSDGVVINEFLNGVEIIMYQARNTPIMQETSTMFCPCRKCKNTKFSRSEMVWKHLVNRGYTPHYYISFQHGEGDHGRNEATSSSHFEDVGNSELGHLHTETSYHQDN